MQTVQMSANSYFPVNILSNLTKNLLFYIHYTENRLENNCGRNLNIKKCHGEMLQISDIKNLEGNVEDKPASTGALLVEICQNCKFLGSALARLHI